MFRSALCTLLMVIGPAAFAPGQTARFIRTELGSRFQVNATNVMGNYAYASLKGGNFFVGMADNGDYVVAWYGKNDGDVFKRAFNANGTPKDTFDVLVSTYTASEQRPLALGVGRNGTYDIAWGSYFQNTASPPWSAASLLARGYNADGTDRYGPTMLWESQANEHAATGSRYAVSAALFNTGNTNDGALIVARHSQHYYYGFKVTQAGATTTPYNVQFSTYGWTSFGDGGGAVALADSGHGVVLGGGGYPQDPLTARARYWIYNNTAGTFAGGGGGSAAYGTWVNAQGKDVSAGGIRVKNWRCDVAMNGSGTGVMVWVINSESNTVNYNNGQLDIAARRFALSGTTLSFRDSDPWLVNQDTNRDQFAPRVAIDDLGRFIVAWQDDDTNIYARVFNDDGTGLDQFVVNPPPTSTNDWYGAVDVAAVRDYVDSLRFVIAYGYTPSNSINRGYNLYAQPGWAVVPKGTIIHIR